MIDLLTASDDAVIDWHEQQLVAPAPARRIVAPPKGLILPSSKFWTPEQLVDQQIAAVKSVRVDNAVRASLSYTQHKFITLPHKYKALVTGFGGGKTFVGCLDLLTFALQHPGTVQGYFTITYGLIRDIFYPTITEAAELLGLTVDIKEGNKEVHIYNGRAYIGMIIARTLDNPANLIGFKIVRALIDELDTMPTEKAKQAFIKIQARMRIVLDGVLNTISVVTTPEGYKFVYDQWAKPPETEKDRIKRAHFGMVQGSTYENMMYLPSDYIQSLLESYPLELVRAYLLGKFVNLRSGSVYAEYDYLKNQSHKKLEPGLALIIGCDFNVGKMAACVMQMHGDELHVVDELHSIHNTAALASKIVARYGEKWGGRITMFPDATDGRSTTSNTTDHQILREAGLTVIANNANPRIVDRVNCVNNQFCDYEGKRKLFVSHACVKTTHGLQAQVYDKNGKPEKESGVDHILDSLGYPITKLKPMRLRRVIR